MLKSYFKTINRMLVSNKVRLSLIAAMTMISVAMVSGVGSIAPRMRSAVDNLAELGYDTSPSGYPFEFIFAQATGIERIAFVFPFFFIGVTCLVVYMTIARMIESERSQIACLKTLGYRQDQIVAKYIYFTLISSVLGAVLGVVLGHFGVAPVIFNSITAHYGILDAGEEVPIMGLSSMLLMIGFSLAVTGFTALHFARGKPSKLLTAKSPKAGGKILMERIPFIWKPLPFKYKSTLRNIFRYRFRLFLTVFSVLFSTALVFMGLALTISMEKSDPEIISTIRPIAVMIVISAVLLSVMIIYNITNMNIEDRKKEIATLKVLGYNQMEVSGYIFREIFLLTLFGIVLGLPAGYFFMGWIFDFLEFGNIDYVYWYVWVATFAVSVLAVILADALLYFKIAKIEMHTSLKAVD